MTTQEQQQTQVAWDKIAAGSDELVTPSHMWSANEGLRRAELRPGMRLLDVAAGSGALSIPAARLGARVLSTDLSPVMLERLEARAREEGLNLETRVMEGYGQDKAKRSNSRLGTLAANCGDCVIGLATRGIASAA